MKRMDNSDEDGASVGGFLYDRFLPVLAPVSLLALADLLPSCSCGCSSQHVGRSRIACLLYIGRGNIVDPPGQ